MGNSNYKENPLSQKGKGKYVSKNKSFKNQNRNKINKINIIDDNSINKKEIKLDVIIETLIRIFFFEKKIEELCNNEDNKNNDSKCVIASKYLIEKYKEIFQFESLKKQFDKNEIILKYINIYSIKNNEEDIPKEGFIKNN